MVGAEYGPDEAIGSTSLGLLSAPLAERSSPRFRRYRTFFPMLPMHEAQRCKYLTARTPGAVQVHASELLRVKRVFHAYALLITARW